eukprot:PLAT15951.1.p1 GENE.PLAT15951.1~~PLAT15951.1.p1  ORF type:complete len:726 (+),score=440.69 PLAT15951.1:25-2202(+)
MELALEQVDITQVSPVSGRQTMVLLPTKDRALKKRSRLIVGDDAGVVSCVKVKKGSTQMVWSEAVEGGAPVACVELSSSGKAEVWLSSGQVLTKLKKTSGKKKSAFDTNMTEVVSSMFVEEAKMHVGGEFVYNYFDHGADRHFYMSPDRINSLTCSYLTRETELDVVLACEDRCVRVLAAGELLYNAVLPGAATVVYPYLESGDRAFGSARDGVSRTVITGLRSGMLAALHLDTEAVARGWTVDEERRTATVNSVAAYDLTGDDKADIIVGRDDGLLQVYGFDHGPAPRLQFEVALDESVRTVKGGIVTSEEYREVLAVTYTGRVLGFTQEPLHLREESDDYGRSRGTVIKEGKIVALRKELETLRDRVAREKEKLAKYADEFIPMAESFKVNHQFALDAEEAAYTLTVEIPMAIDVVALRSTVRVMLMDVDSNQAIVSTTTGDEENPLLATYRCQEETNRLEMRLRTMEGRPGELEVAVLARMTPPTAQLLKLNVKPLGLHHRIYTPLREGTPLSVLRFSGSFSVNMAHEWVVHCLPEVPPHVTGDDMELLFVNSFVGTVLSCEYRRGEATFRSDSVTTLAILREAITKEAIARKVRVDMHHDIEPASVPHVLALLHPKLDYQLSLASKVDMIEALEEVKMQEADLSYLAADYRAILDNAETIRREFKNRPRALEALFGVVSDLYIDKHKFAGYNASSRGDDLMRVLYNYTPEALAEFFEEPVV